MKFKEIAGIFKEYETEHFKVEKILPKQRTICIKYYNDDLKDFPYYNDNYGGMTREIRVTVSYYENTILIIFKMDYYNEETKFRKRFGCNSRISFSRNEDCKKFHNEIKHTLVHLEKHNTIYVKEAEKALESDIYLAKIKEECNKNVDVDVYENSGSSLHKFRYDVDYDRFTLNLSLDRRNEATANIRIGDLFMRSNDFGHLIETFSKVADVMDKATNEANEIIEAALANK